MFRAAAEATRRERLEAVFRNVVCGVDGSASGETAARQAASLSGVGGTVEFLAVHRAAAGGEGFPPLPSRESSELALAEAERMAESRGILATCSSIPSERPSRALRARGAEADLLAIGSQSGDRSYRPELGITATQIAHRFARPLLIARPAIDRGPFPQAVVLASDGSQGSWGATQLVARIASLRRARVTVVHVPGADRPSSGSAEVEQQLALIESIAGAPPSFSHKRGAVAERILQASRNGAGTILVLGRHGLRGRGSLGGVAEQVAHRAACSVLLVPSDLGGAAALDLRGAAS